MGCLIRVCLLVFLLPFVVDAFIMAVLAEATPVSMLVEVLHHFLEIFLCLHKSKSKCDFLVLSGDNWREKKNLLGDKSA